MTTPENPTLLGYDEFGRAVSAPTLRDIFAGLVEMGLQANPETPDDWLREHGASYCWERADALLAERAKEAE